MGQTSSSSAPDGPDDSSVQKTCYYELLSVERTATQEDIKKAYRRKALELHPDRNYGDVERATKLFAEISAAYEVLSDPQERAWYDSHRDAILRGDNDGSSGPGYNANVTTAEDVIRWFSKFTPSISYDDDNPKSFYGVLNTAFSTLADEESIAFHDNPDVDPGTEHEPSYPVFGDSKKPYEGPDGVKQFYHSWINFRTYKTFAWMDQYRYSDAPDRRVKRAMEKENAMLREQGRREFVGAVVEFVKFVRKRDPRYTANVQTEAQRQAALLKASQEQAARHRRENAEKRKNFKAAEWTQFEQLEDDEEQVDSEEEEEEEKVEEKTFECIVCKKTFRSRGQMDAHEKSKKHVKAVKDLQRQMRKENKEFHLDRDVRGKQNPEKPEIDFDPVDFSGEEEAAQEELLAEMIAAGEADGQQDDGAVGSQEDNKSPHSDAALNGHTAEPKEESPSVSSTPPSDEENEDADYVSPEKFASRLTISDPDPSSTQPSDSEPSNARPPKLGKAKAKRLKKAQQAEQAQQKNQQGGEFTCEKCHAGFPSKSRLFTHLKENPGHAKLVPASNAKGKKGKR